MTIEHVRGPLLVLQSIEQDVDDPTRWTGTVFVGGHQARVTLAFGRFVLGFVEHVDVPTVLSVHQPSLAAVVAAMSRAAAGEEIGVPLDLSDEVRSADPPFPFLPLDDAERERLEAAADAVPLKVVSVEREGTDPPTVSAHLILDERAITVRARLFTAPGAPTVSVWLQGPRQSELTDEQRYSIQRVLLGAIDE